MQLVDLENALMQLNSIERYIIKKKFVENVNRIDEIMFSLKNDLGIYISETTYKRKLRSGKYKLKEKHLL